MPESDKKLEAQGVKSEANENIEKKPERAPEAAPPVPKRTAEVIKKEIDRTLDALGQEFHGLQMARAAFPQFKDKPPETSVALDALHERLDKLNAELAAAQETPPSHAAKENPLEGRDHKAGGYRVSPEDLKATAYVPPAQPETPDASTETLMPYENARALLEEIAYNSPNIGDGLKISSMLKELDYGGGVEGIDKVIKFLDILIRTDSTMLRDHSDLMKDRGENEKQLEQEKAVREVMAARRKSTMDNLIMVSNTVRPSKIEQADSSGKYPEKNQSVGPETLKESTQSGTYRVSPEYMKATAYALGEVNKQEATKKSSFREAKELMEKIARNLDESSVALKLGRDSGGDGIRSLSRGMDRPEVEGIDKAIKYFNDILDHKWSSMINNPERLKDPEFVAELEEQGAAREALIAERTKRLDKKNSRESGTPSSEIPNREQTQAETVEAPKEPAPAAAAGENNKANPEPDGARNRPAPDKATPEQRKITEAPKERFKNEYPTDRRELFQYQKQHFDRISGANLDSFTTAFTTEVEADYRGYVEAVLKNLIAEKPANARYADTVASVLGNTPAMLQRIIALDSGKWIDQEIIGRMPFSQAAAEYLHIQLPEDYFSHFSPRQRVVL